jgi:hypothetical protein
VFSESGRRCWSPTRKARAWSWRFARAAGLQVSGTDWDDKGEQDASDRSRVLGYIPTARYPSALAIVGSTLFVGNGKGAGRAERANEAFPPNHTLRGRTRRGSRGASAASRCRIRRRSRR